MLPSTKGPEGPQGQTGAASHQRGAAADDYDHIP